jgi:predicted RNase H-like HicB family nuclease
MKTYDVIVERNNGHFRALFPSLPNISAEGATRDEAIAAATVAARQYLRKVEITTVHLAESITSQQDYQQSLADLAGDKEGKRGESQLKVKCETMPVPEPDSEPNRRWMREHRREYPGQWVALDGERLIAHGADSQAVFAAAKLDGAYLPLIAYIPPANEPPFIGV